ncbi:hypothetical protein CRG98_024174 [Punica granatum]|uniref:Uncharacterized protein n=1 Tax=Punica granatum TaxID=22663 RepID=A0A2I0JGL9_PUNGR|nr:hypothetical protein CRG98_024174 [Punica granatum]
MRPKPAAGPKPNARAKPYAGSKLDEIKCGVEARWENARNAKAKVDRPSGHGSSCRDRRVKTAGGLPVVVGTTCLSFGMGGRDGLGPLVTAHLTMEK